MGQCNAKTKTGKQCEIPTKSGETYCHLHAKKKPKNIFKFLSQSALIAFILGVLGFLANLAGLFGFFKIDFSSFSQTATTSFLTTPTPSAYDVDLKNFSSENFAPVAKLAVNLDGYGTDELILKNGLTPWKTSAIKVLAYLPNNEFGVYETPGKWDAILTSTMDLCGNLDYGLIDLKKDGNKQLIIFEKCGTGSFVFLQIYEYSGLRLMDLIYEQNQPIWSNSTVRIANENAYIVSVSHGETFKLHWNDDIGVEAVKLDIPLSSKTQSIAYWRNKENIMFTSQLIKLRKGEAFQLYHDVDSDTDPCVPQFSISSGLEITEYSELFVATKSGTSEIMISCWGGEAAGNLIVSIGSFP